MRKNLFRPEVSETNSQSWLGEIRLATPVSHQVWAIGALLCMTAILAWLFLGEYTRRERVQGVLVPVGGYARLKARGSGEVFRLRVREGDMVKEGQVLLEIDNDRYVAADAGVADDVSATIEQEKSTLRGDIASARRAAEQRRQDLRSQIALVRQQIGQTEQMLALYREEARMQRDLLDKIEPALAQGYVSATQVQQQRSAVASANASVGRQQAEMISLEKQLRELEGKLAQIPHEMNAQINDAIRQLARTDASYDKNEAERSTVVRAPMAGVVSSILVRSGQTVVNGTPLVTVVPANAAMEAELYVPSSAAGFVRPGSVVTLHYQAFPFQKFGVHRGRVEFVSRSALTPAEIAEITGATNTSEPMYRVRVSIREQSIDVYGEKKPLTAGMTVTGGLMLDKRRIYEWVFEPLYTLRKKMEEEQ